MNERSIEMESIENPPEEYLLWRAERQRRLRIILAALPAILGISALLLALLLPDYIDSIFPFLNRSVVSIIAPAMLLISGMSVLMIYLQTGFSKKADKTTEFLRYEEELKRLRNRIEHGDTVSNKE